MMSKNFSEKKQKDCKKKQLLSEELLDSYPTDRTLKISKRSILKITLMTMIICLSFSMLGSIPVYTLPTL